MTGALNRSLRRAIDRSGLKQLFIAKQAGISKWRLSRIVHGVTEATPDERRAIAKVLGRRPHELFSEAA